MLYLGKIGQLSSEAAELIVVKVNLIFLPLLLIPSAIACDQPLRSDHSSLNKGEISVLLLFFFCRSYQNRKAPKLLFVSSQLQRCSRYAFAL